MRLENKTSCSIIIYNYESLNFLKAVVRKVRQYKHEDIEQHIIISEQSEGKHHSDVVDLYGSDSDITIVPMQSICSGYSIDYIIRNVEIKTEFIATLDVDAFPINKNWLAISLDLLINNNLKFVGVHADIEDAYSKYGNFFIIAQHFRVGRYVDFKDLAFNAGWTKFTHRPQIKKEIYFANHDWGNRAKELNEDGWADSSVTAHWWEDKYRNNNKFGYAVTHTIGVEGEEDLYGRIADGLIFHFAFSYTSLGIQDRMSSKYLNWTKRINEDFSDELIDEMLACAKPLNNPIKREFWDGTLKKIVEVPKDINDKIDKNK